MGTDKALFADMLQTVSGLYAHAPGSIGERGRAALGAIETLSHEGNSEYVPNKNVEYPKGEMGNRMKSVAQLLKMGLHIDVATIDMGGWDTHKNQGQEAEGFFAKQVEQLSESLQALYQDLYVDGANSPLARTTIVVMTEFGRRLRENINRGTDHGHGGMMLVLGESVRGGQVYGSWPGLKTEQLYERADLAVTTDFRAILSEVLHHRRAERALASVFPGYTVPKELGLFRA